MSDIVFALQLLGLLCLLLFVWTVGAGWFFDRGKGTIEAVTWLFIIAAGGILALSLFNAALIPLTGSCISFRGDEACELTGALPSLRTAGIVVSFLALLRFALLPVLVRASNRLLAYLQRFRPSPLIAPHNERKAFYLVVVVMMATIIVMMALSPLS